jgi:hypothetical protein
MSTTGMMRNCLADSANEFFHMLTFELATDPLVLVALLAVAFVAGFIDAIAGGGGLLTLPALLTAGLPPHLVLGTNKLLSLIHI